MHLPRHRTFSVLLALGLTPAASMAVDFAHDIVPVLREHCADCHTGEKKKGGFSMNSRGDLLAGSENGKMIAAGKSAESKLVELLTTDDKDAQMPPSDAKQKRVPAEKLALLREWIDGGVSWQDGFTFKKAGYEPPLKPRRPALPPVVDGRANPIDRILDAYHAKHSTPRPQPLDDATFARRVHLDLIGLLPEPVALGKFLADSAPDKRARLVQTLLARDVDYAEHWLTFWNDLLRNDYARVGFGPGTGAPITRWLYAALLNNQPYDQFVRELIAPPTPESAGFSAGLAWRGTVSASQVREVQFAQSVSQAFLGINMKCASCHDSFVDRWKLSEAYGLAAIYAQQPLKIARCDKETGQVATAAWLFPELGNVTADAPQPERLKQLAALMTHPENGRFTRTMVNRLWHRLMGRGIVHPVDSMQTEPWSADLLDVLAVQFRDDGFDVKKTLALICTSQAYQSRAVVREKDDNTGTFVFTGPRAKRMTAEQFMDAVWTLTGTWPERSDAAVVRGKLETLPGMQSQGVWIWGASAANGALPPGGEIVTLRHRFDLPVPPERATAMVTADNEYTLYLNGKKIGRGTDWTKPVRTTLLGALQVGQNELLLVAKNAGTTPSAAAAFFEARLVFADGRFETIASSVEWKCSQSFPDGEGRFQVDPTDWQPALAAAAPGTWSGATAPLLQAYLSQASLLHPPPVRASLMKADLLQRALGRPNREQIVSMRPEELTTLEALDLANGDLLGNALAAGAKQLTAKSWPSSDALTTWVYRAALSREPSVAELASARPLLGEKPAEAGVQDLLWAVCMLPEFQLVR